MSKLWNVVLLSSTAIYGCSDSAKSVDVSSVDDAGTKTNEPAKPSGSSVSVLINAASGGTVAVGGGTLVIPPGSLAADTTITASAAAAPASLPEVATVVGQVFDFGPDGTRFAPAATLRLPLPTAPEQGKKAVISWLNASNVWVDLATTTAAGEVSAPVDHFTSLAVRTVPFSALLYPAKVGFELDGNDYPQKPNTAGCAAAGGRYYVRQDGSNAVGDATSYAIFDGDAAPAPGTYPVVQSANAVTAGAGNVHVTFNDSRDRSDYWNSDGTTGTVTVVAGANGAFDVVWSTVSLTRGAKSQTIPAGKKSSSASGWQTCMPK